MIPQVWALIVKDVLILATATSVHWTLTPPNPPVAREEFVERTFFEKSVRYRAFLDKTIIWTLSLIEIVDSYVLSQNPASTPLCPSSNRQAVFASLHPILIVGVIASVVSSACRIWCYSALGDLYDFQARIKPNHRLVTSSPYSFVRHPGYTAAFASYGGATMVICSPGNWLRECGISSYAGLLLFTLWFLESVYMLAGLPRRIRLEDEILRSRFGREWENYARRVPYRLLPGIY